MDVYLTLVMVEPLDLIWCRARTCFTSAWRSQQWWFVCAWREFCSSAETLRRMQMKRDEKWNCKLSLLSQSYQQTSSKITSYQSVGWIYPKFWNIKHFSHEMSSSLYQSHLVGLHMNIRRSWQKGSVIRRFTNHPIDELTTSKRSKGQLNNHGLQPLWTFRDSTFGFVWNLVLHWHQGLIPMCCQRRQQQDMGNFARAFHFAFRTGSILQSWLNRKAKFAMVLV